MFVALAKGREDLKALILKEKKKKKKKKKKKTAGILNLGRRFKGPLKQPVDLTSSSKEGENQERERERERERQGMRTLTLKFLIMTPTIMMNSILQLRIDTNS